jgi:hypothetical protein
MSYEIVFSIGLKYHNSYNELLMRLLDAIILLPAAKLYIKNVWSVNQETKV